ncbi:L-type lectin-domain containing receptor kinase SIT2-like [Nymphaea colorata]|uniref:non-specific serine/threonine protein kinase n=1 Tax=Nymphaea colorata TaxID=210225 RepID=A0A5K1BA02_9MAGN|nr:L-type lectin-domain containing receptor kinase SIT2-like [Nymphaea colorata]
MAPPQLPSKTLLLFLLHLLLVHLPKAATSTADSFNYNGFKTAGLILTDESGLTSTGALQLTRGDRALWKKGHAFHGQPLRFKQFPSSAGNTTVSFSTRFVFAIVNEIEYDGGNGLAFAIAPSTLSNAMGGDYLGLVRNNTNGNFSNHVFAVEFDTYQGTWLNDLNDNHVGVDINGVTSNKSETAAYFTDDGKSQRIDLKSGDLIQAWIDYNGSEKWINVTVAPISHTSKPARPLISYSIDLYPVLLDSMYVGFSSGTSRATSAHYVLAWSFAINGEAQELDVSHLPKIPKKKTSWKSSKLLPYSTTLSLLFLMMLGSVAYLVYKRRKLTSETVEEWELDYPHRLPYKEIYRATNGFSEKELLGRGGFGSVYRGVLRSNGMEVAVKKVAHDGKQGMKEFVSEVSSLGRLRHRNLVQLQGWCRRKDELLLVYEFMPNGSLDTFLFNAKKRHLSWDERFKILKGIASGLLYLHEGWEQVVIHRDVKASNVLLDAELNGKLGDFGLARLYEHGTNPQTTHIVGTLGYMAPELSITGKATKSSDVFGFGAFLLEMACGRRPVEATRPSDEMVLVSWVHMCWRRGELLSVVDDRLGKKYVEAEVELVLKLGVLCSQTVPEARPSMRQVVQFLDGDVPLQEVPLEKLLVEDDLGYDQLVMAYPSSDKFTSKSSSRMENSEVSRDLYLPQSGY